MKIKFGPASWVATAAMLQGYIPLFVKLVQEGHVAVNQPEKWMAIGAFIGTAGLLLGRFGQAIAHILSGTTEVDAPSPEFAALPTTSPADIPADVGDKGSP